MEKASRNRLMESKNPSAALGRGGAINNAAAPSGGQAAKARRRKWVAATSSAAAGSAAATGAPSSTRPRAPSTRSQVHRTADNYRAAAPLQGRSNTG